MSATTKNDNGKYQPDLEAFEGMLVKFTGTLTISEMYNLARFNEIKLVQGTRPYSFTQKNTPSVAAYESHVQELGARRITYDDGLSFQNQLICNLDGFGELDVSGNCVNGGFNTMNSPRMGDTVSDLTGVLYYKWAGASSSGSTWRVTSIQDGTVSFLKANPRPQGPPSVGGALTLVSLNALNLFRTLDEGSSTTQNGLEPRGADNQEEFDRQVQKLINSIIELDPDILGIQELENYFSPSSAFNALEFLVMELNMVAGDGYFNWVNPGQEYVDISDAISSGFLYKTSTIDSVVGNVAILRDEVLHSIGVDNSTPVFDGPNTNRASIAASFKPKGGACITAAVNHLKSKGGSGTGDDADKLDGSGNWNARRLKGAKAIHAWMDSDPTEGGCSLKALMGDMNAYAMEDPIKYFESVGYTDVDFRFNGDDAYSYVFDGQIGTLDYVLVNAAFNNFITGASSWHVNADEAAALDYNTDYGRDKNIFNANLTVRFSDHDPMVVGFNVEATSPINIPTLAPSNSPTKTCPTIASKVKIQSVSGLPIQMREVRVFSSGVNVAIGRNATQSSDLNGSSIASKSVDDKWGSWSSTGTDGWLWWELDLGEPLPVEKVIIVNRKCHDDATCSCKLSYAALSLFDNQGKLVASKNTQNTCGKGWIVRKFPQSAANCVGNV